MLNNILLRGDRAVDIANAPASGASLPQRELLNLAESQCHKLILGQTLTSDTSQHGGSLAQAKVHAGVHAEVVKKRAVFVADVLNSQLIPAIVLLNYGTLDVPMPELVFKLPQEGVTLERVQVLKTALEIKGMRIKKSEAYEFMGFAQPAEGDDVFEAASDGGEMAGLAGMLAKGKGKPQDTTDPEDDPPKPKKKVKPSTSDDAEPVSAANAEEIDAANPYGCNQYGEGWKMPHNGRASKPGAPVKKTDSTEEERKQKEEEERQKKLKSLNDQPFDNGRSALEIRTNLSATEIADLLNNVGYRYGSQRQEMARAWEGYGVSRIYFGRDFITIKDGVITNRDLRKTRACTACDDAINAINIVLGNNDSDNVRSARTDAPTDPAQEWLAPIKQKFLEARRAGASMADLKQMLLTMHPNTKALAKAFANNILAGFAGEGEEVDAANPYGCNDHQHKCPQKGTTRESKLKTKPRLFRVDPDASIHKQKVQLAEAIEKAAHDGVHLEAVITRPEFGELIIDCGKPGKTEAKRNREQKEENEKAAKEGRERKIISSGGNGAIHAMEGRHHVNPFDIAEAIIEGKVTQDINHASRINL